MGSLESLKSDFKSQVTELSNLQNKSKSSDCIFIGLGDSYVAGLIAEFFTDHKSKCYSPSELMSSKFEFDKDYYFISVTGRTRSNIDLARRATREGVKTIAITLNTESQLAKECKEVIPVGIKKIDTVTAGYSSFTANVVTCLQLGGVALSRNFLEWHRKGVERSTNLINSISLPNDVLYILGNDKLYPLALYASLQMAEFFGTTAMANKLEDFCHSPIFGFKKSHDIWILGQGDDDAISRKLSQLDLKLLYIDLSNSDIFAQLFESLFFLQSLILLLAEKYGQTELEYIVNQEKLKTSSDIIYNNAFDSLKS